MNANVSRRAGWWKSTDIPMASTMTHQIDEQIDDTEKPRERRCLVQHREEGAECRRARECLARVDSGCGDHLPEHQDHAGVRDDGEYLAEGRPVARAPEQEE